MSARANYFKLGLFIVVGTTIGILALVAFGLGAMFSRPVTIETYVDESVQGLDIGSKVKFRGVTVGAVSRIGFTSVRYQQERPASERKRYVLIEIELRRGEMVSRMGEALQDLIVEAVPQGLRIRLASQGVTGLAYLEMDYLEPERNPPLPIDWEPINPYVPSAPSTVTRLLTAAETVFSKLDQIDLEKLATSLTEAVDLVKDKLEDVDVTQLNRNANEVLEETKQTVTQLQRTLRDLPLEELSKNANEAISGVRRIVDSNDIPSVVQQLDKTLRRLDQLLAGNESDLGQSVANLRALSESLRELAENAKRYPAQLLFGQPPKPVKLEGK
jgi:ABC-type transporter Mla subunit MlaD